jgi:DNA invertase Pin-like site-specific DNA recombinase
MPKITGVLDEAREMMSKRLDELNEERQRLERALAALGGKATGRRPGRPRESKAKAAAAKPSPRRRRRRGGGRADQALGLIEKSPGITASEVAEKLKVKPNYLYRVLGDLEKEGRVKKDGRQYHPAAAKAA